MMPALKWKCSWSTVAFVVSILTLGSVVHLFLLPVVPSLDFIKFWQVHTTYVPISWSSKGQENGKTLQIQNQQPKVTIGVNFPSDSNKVVVFRGTPWRAEIGQWLSDCSSVTNPVKILEKIGGRSCKNDCSGQGVCNYDLGECRCFLGYQGEGCSAKRDLSCNYEQTDNEPYGPYVSSICSAYCDTTRAMCFCGKGTKYPNRPVAYSCGFEVNLPDGPNGTEKVNWGKPDLDNILSTNNSKLGWCSVDPDEAYALDLEPKKECGCPYGDQVGQFCEIPVLSVCINQCSGHGHCRGGFCQCDGGWFGTDCSIPSVMSSIKEWPQWLLPAQIGVPNRTDDILNLNAEVEKKRPLIYVYDLPPQFNSQLLEGRLSRLECVNRIYDPNNGTRWTEELYGSQMAFQESILASAHRTLNGEEADFFFVPVLDACLITLAGTAPYFDIEEHGMLRSSRTLEFYKEAYDHITAEYPYWNRSSGRDHIWFFAWDEGACYAPKEIWNSTMLVHWGNTNSKHNYSTTAYWADSWDDISPERRGNHSCFDPDKDLVIPAWKRPDVNSLMSQYWSWPLEKRKTLFYFNGNLGPAYKSGRPEDTYSMKIRQRVAEEFGSTPNMEGNLGRQHAKDVIVTSLRSHDYQRELASSIFCGVFPGDGWSGRMEDSILQGCIPVIIQDGIFLPYENVLSYENFAVRIREDEIPNLLNILRGLNETEIKFKLENVQKIWQRFLYRDSILLEAERQKSTYGRTYEWGDALSQLKDDEDAFSTVMEVLHYKLHNDPWRRGQVVEMAKKDFGLPQKCLIN